VRIRGRANLVTVHYASLVAAGMRRSTAPDDREGKEMTRNSKAMVALTVLTAVVTLTGVAETFSAGAATHRVSVSSPPSTAKLQKEITALKREVSKHYLRAAKARSTYLRRSKAARTFIKGHGSVVQGTLANLVLSNTPTTLLTSPGGLTFKVANTIDNGVELEISNNTSRTQTLMMGSNEQDLAPNAVTSLALDLPGQFEMQILNNSSPLEIDTLSLVEDMTGGPEAGPNFWAQLVHSGS
jgi:hypothetical protein